MAAEQKRPDVVTKRENWFQLQTALDPNKLVFLDETWGKTNMTRRYGRSYKGTRLIEYVPHGHWKTTTFLAGMRASGWIAPLVVDGAINGEIFKKYVSQHLIKELKQDDILILDNLSSHKSVEVIKAVESVGAKVLFLPPYSPDLNPIEMAFSKFKQLIRSKGERMVEGLWKYMGEALDKFKPHEFLNYIHHCGYRYS